MGYPTSCSPQAWASATPFSLLRTLLRLDPSVGDGAIWLAPKLPRRLGEVRIEHVPIGRHRATIEAAGTKASVRGLGSEMRVIARPRPVPPTRG